MSEGLVELARRYVAVSDELEVIRGEIRKAVLNGGGTPEAARPTRAERPGRQAAQAEKAETQILELLRATPNLGTAALVRATDARGSTVSERLRRMKAKNLVQGGGAEGWRVTAPA
jgi:hypothetical protein